MSICYVSSKSEAIQAAKKINGTFRKVEDGWAVMDWSYYFIWSKQK